MTSTVPQPKIGERSAVISGIGQSDVGRRLGRSGLSLTVDAALEAIEDAGLTRADIDGVSTYPGLATSSPGMSPVGVPALKDALRLEPAWYSGGAETPGQYGAMFNAIAAVAAGFANHVLVFRTVTESSAQTSARRASVVGSGGERIGGVMQWMVPFGAVSAANWNAAFCQLYMHRYGLQREQLGQISLVARSHAQLNPKAIYRDPLTMDDYLSSRMISWPLCLYDCDVPCDGSEVLIVSRADAAADFRHPPVHIEAIGCALNGRDSWDQRADLTTMASHDAAAMMWDRTDLTVDDVDVAELYDGFTYITVMWLEGLGFFPKGEAGPFLEGGDNIRLGGRIPLNTHGGQLSAGRLHGYGYLHEACLQLRGAAEDRQVPDAEVAVVGAGGGPLGGCMLLTKHR